MYPSSNFIVIVIFMIILYFFLLYKIHSNWRQKTEKLLFSEWDRWSIIFYYISGFFGKEKKLSWNKKQLLKDKEKSQINSFNSNWDEYATH